MAERAVLAIEFGATGTRLALVEGARVLAEATASGAGPAARVEAAARAASPWTGRYDRVGVAAAGLVSDGVWSAPAPAAPDGGHDGTHDGAFPIEARMAQRLGVPATALGRGQAAAWGEHRFGAGRGAGDMVLLAIGAGMEGGIVVNGRLLRGRGGLAGLIGAVLPILGVRYADIPIEDGIAGRWMAAKAAQLGHPTDARGVLAASAGPGPEADWARAVVLESARRTVRVLIDLQLVLAPDRVVMGGAVGLAPGHVGRIEALLGDLPAQRRPALAPAALGRRAALLGAADLARAGAVPLAARPRAVT